MELGSNIPITISLGTLAGVALFMWRLRGQLTKEIEDKVDKGIKNQAGICSEKMGRIEDAVDNVKESVEEIKDEWKDSTDKWLRLALRMEKKLDDQQRATKDN